MSEFHDPIHNVASIGPFQHWPLTVNGWTVPNLEAHVRGDTDGKVTFTLDRRFEVDVPHEFAGTFAAFLADVVAVSMGHACHPRNSFQPGEPRPDPVTPPLLPWRHMMGTLPGDIQGLPARGDEGGRG